MLNLREGVTETVGVGKRGSACVGCERCEGLLLRRELPELVGGGAARKRRQTAATRLARPASWHDSLQAP